MKINNVTLFFIGIISILLGGFIIIFDYSQIQFLNNLSLEPDYLLDEEKKNIHQRLITEYFIGNGILILGISLLIYSILFRIKNRTR